MALEAGAGEGRRKGRGVACPRRKWRGDERADERKGEKKTQIKQD